MNAPIKKTFRPDNIKRIERLYAEKQAIIKSLAQLGLVIEWVDTRHDFKTKRCTGQTLVGFVNFEGFPDSDFLQEEVEFLTHSPLLGKWDANQAVEADELAADGKFVAAYERALAAHLHGAFSDSLHYPPHVMLTTDLDGGIYFNIDLVEKKVTKNDAA